MSAEIDIFKRIYCYHVQDVVYRREHDCKSICILYNHCIGRQWADAAEVFRA